MFQWDRVLCDSHYQVQIQSQLEQLTASNLLLGILPSSGLVSFTVTKNIGD